MLLSADDHTLYVADARGQVIYRYDVAGPGRLANERLWIDRLGANPDGLTLDEHDNLYICCGKAGAEDFRSRRARRSAGSTSTPPIAVSAAAISARSASPRPTSSSAFARSRRPEAVAAAP